MRKDLDGVKLLLMNDIDINKIDIDGKTPLIFASES
jgi:ankyrin repeat protein